MIRHTFKGKERSFRFDFKAIVEWCEMEKISINDMDTILENITLKGFCKLTYWAHKSANPDADITVDDVVDWFNDEPSAFGELMKAMQETDFMQPQGGEGEEVKAKKKRSASTK